MRSTRARVATWLVPALALLAAAVPTARADTHSSSYSIWTVSDTRVLVRYLVPVEEAKSLTGTDLPVLTSSKLADYILKHVGVSAAGHQCAAIDQGFDLGRVNPLNVGSDLYGYEVLFRCDSPRSIVLRNDALFAHLPGHVNFARVQFDSQFSEQLFTADRVTLPVPDTGVLPAAGLGRYLKLGLSHILHSADRLCFLLGVMLLLRRRRQAVSLTGGLALGYLGSALLAGAGWLVPRMTLVDAGIGLLVLVPAIRILAPRRSLRNALLAGGLALLLTLGVLYFKGSAPALLIAGAALLLGSSLAVPARLSSRESFTLLWAGLFGFLDGFVMPSQLLPLQLPAGRLLRIVLGFDLGAVLADAVLIALALGVAYAWCARTRAWSRPLLNDLAGAALGGMGAFWLLSRLYG